MSEYQNKYLNAAGIKYLWNKAIGLFVKKDGNKVLSDNNYSDEDKAKLEELVEASQTAVTQDDLLALKEDLSKVYKYAGSVETVAALEEVENPESGDVYDVVENGMNYAWNADENRWDALGSLIHIDVLTNEDLDAIIAEEPGDNPEEEQQ